MAGKGHGKHATLELEAKTRNLEKKIFMLTRTLEQQAAKGGVKGGGRAQSALRRKAGGVNLVADYSTTQKPRACCGNDGHSK